MSPIAKRDQDDITIADQKREFSISKMSNSHINASFLQNDSRIAKSANPGKRRNTNLNTSARPFMVDLTVDEKSYGFRPSTAMQMKQLLAIT
jgi:hypothetical protein